MNKCTLFLLLVGLVQVLPAAANDEDVQKLLPLSLEDLLGVTVSISTNTRQSLSKAPSVVTLITADDIKAAGASNLMEILQSVPGIYIKNNLFGFKPLITYRGASGANVLLMVNGAPAKDLVWSPGIFWKGMPANMIERVEVIRGPGSALFGSDAAAGAINVITKTAAAISKSEAGVRTGSFETNEAWVQHGTSWNGLDIAVTANLSHTDGHNPYIAKDRINTPPQSARYGWDNQDIHLAVGKDNWRLLADYTRHSNVEIGLTGAAVLDPLTRASDRLAGLALLYSNETFARDWGLNAELRYREMEYSSGNGFWERPPGFSPASFNELNSAERRLNFELSGVYSGVRNHVLRVGGGYVWHDLFSVRQLINGMPGNFAPEKLRRNSYLFAQDVWSLADGWELTAGARYDDYSDFGSTLNPRIALVWQGTDRLTTKLMYGQAFRAPSYLELYSATSANIPNPGLKPETSRTWDLSFSFLATRDLRLGVTAYRFDRRDVIAPDPVSNKFENFDRYLTNGIELEAQWKAARNVMVSGNLSRMKDVDSPLRDLAIPLQQAYLRLDWGFLPKWNWNMQTYWFDKRPLPATDPRLPAGAYTLVNTTIRYTHDRSWEFAASIHNLFNRDVRDYSSTRLPNNLPLPGRNFFAELRYKF